jgi:phage terminase large subunit-like protein
MPGAMNMILRLHFCVWTDATTAWMSREVLQRALVEIDVKSHYGKVAGLGVDLSKTKDITALGCAVQSGVVESGEHKGKPIVDAWVEAWTPLDTLAARATKDKAPYQLWVQQGHLLAPKGEIISYRHVAQAISEYEHNYKVLALGYDRYAYRSSLEPELNDLGLKVQQVEHPQGGTKKGKPTEEMVKAAKAAGKEAEGLWMPHSVKLFETMLMEGRLRLHENPVLISAIMSAVTDEDRWGNYWLAKERAVNKIDAAIAVIMAVGVLLSVPPEVKRSPQLLIF